MAGLYEAIKYEIVPPSCSNGFLYDGQQGNEDASKVCSCSTATPSTTCCYNQGAMSSSTCTDTSSGGTETACSCVIKGGYNQYCLGYTSNDWPTATYCDGVVGRVVYIGTTNSCPKNENDVYLGQTTLNDPASDDWACLAPDIRQCVNDYSNNIITEDLQVNNVSWNNSYTAPSGSPAGGYITCEFGLTGNFESVQQINDWMSLYLPSALNTSVPTQDVWDANNNVFNNNIMPYFCGRPINEDPNDPDDQGCSLTSISTIPQTTNVCQIIPGVDLYTAMMGYTEQTGEAAVSGLTGCSRFNANGPAGDLCRTWEAGLLCQGNTGPPIVNATYDSFCGKYVCSNDCVCINAATVDPNFQQIVNSAGGSSVATDYQCWYLPCQQQSELVPTNLEVKSTCPGFQSGTCPSQICESVQNIVDNLGTINSNTSSYISCNSTSAPTTTNNTQTFWGKYGVYILVGLGAIIILLLIIGAIFIFHGK